MARIRHLTRAPITEALIDFRVSAPKEFDATKFLALKKQLGDRYPNVQERRGAEAAIEFGPGKFSTHTEDLGLHGYFFKSADGLNIAQFRVDGFTFNRLKPYTSWEQIFPEALSLWKLYTERVSPECVSRLALRYINHLNIRLPIEDFSQYLTSPPVVPPELPQEISSFLTRVVLHEPELSLAANVTQALEKGLDPNSVAVILDIDANKVGEFDPHGEEISQVLEALHVFKNRIFFSRLTARRHNIVE